MSAQGLFLALAVSTATVTPPTREARLWRDLAVCLEVATGQAAEIHHLSTTLGDLRGELAGVAARPPEPPPAVEAPEPEAPWWVPWAVVGALAVGAGLGAAGAIAAVEAGR